MHNVDTSETLFRDWTPPAAPRWMAGMCKAEKVAFSSKFALMPGPIQQAESDGLPQLVPIIVAMSQRPKEIRKAVGKAVWKRMHHATVATNAKRARIWFRDRDKIDWPDLVQIQPCHLSRALNAIRIAGQADATIYAGIHAPQGAFPRIRMLWVDTQRMGGQPKECWSITRLQKEHDALAKEHAAANLDATPWAAPCVIEQDGYLFERLISDLDMAQEGLAQRHCIASYTSRARAHKVIAFRVTGAERATYAFAANTRWDELQCFANSNPSIACWRAAKAAQATFRLEADPLSKANA